MNGSEPPYGGAEQFIHGFIQKIKMVILAKLLSIVFFKELVFTKCLFIYLHHQTESFNSDQNAS